MPEQFEVTTEVVEAGIHRISIRGELDLETAPRLEEKLTGARSRDGISVLIDLSDCEFIDSSGVSLIVGCWRDLERKGGDERLVLCCAKDQVKRLLKITGVEGSISIHDELDQALRELRGENETARPA
jgi:anti-sigma B factor antagonist